MSIGGGSPVQYEVHADRRSFVFEKSCTLFDRRER
jgi:hypothetical protein